MVQGGYIRVVQDVRGKYGSEGDYVMNRPLAGSPSTRPGRSFHRCLGHHRVADQECARVNGKVGIIGGSYDGFCR
jgi:predicted acyl esterase